MPSKAPKMATVTRWGRALNQPRKGQEVVIMARRAAPEDTSWGVREGDLWALVAWVYTQRGCVPAETYVQSCWIPAGWLDVKGAPDVDLDLLTYAR